LKVPDALAALPYDAIRECSERWMKRKERRKAFVLLSDGVGYRSKSSLGTAIEYARRGDTIVYSILFAEPLRPYRLLRFCHSCGEPSQGQNGNAPLATELAAYSSK
jgi:hypothetical protein